MTIRVLAIGDTANNIAVLKKFVKKSKIHLINFPRKGAAVLTYVDDIEFFNSLKISKQVKKINGIKENFDICIVMSWAAARIAYLADLNYIMYFVGGDIMTPPFIKNAGYDYLNEPIRTLNFVERWFYRNVFESAIACVTTTKEYFDQLKKYRKDAIRIDRIAVDTTIFNENVKPMDKKKEKFTFFSPQRNGPEKGMDIIWSALPLCKSDFEIIMVEWFDERTPQEKKIVKQLLEKKPSQISFIPIIKREDMARYYAYADAILGQMRAGIQGAIEREAVFCKKPVITYCDPDMKTIIDGKEITPTFLPNSRDPNKLAELIDKVVESKEFREKLLEEEYKFVSAQGNPDKAAADWDNLFESTFKKYKSIRRNSPHIKIKFLNFVSFLFETFVYNITMKKKNIQAFGESEYKRLTK